MPAGNYNLTIDRGGALQLPMTYKDGLGNLINLTGYTAKMQIRDSFDSPNPVISITHASSADGQVILGGAAGTIVIYVKATATANLAPGEYVYDLFLIPASGDNIKLIYGTAKVLPSATQF